MQRFSSALYLEQIWARQPLESEESRHSILSFGSESPGDGEIADTPREISISVPPVVVTSIEDTPEPLNTTLPQKTEIPQEEEDNLSHTSAHSEARSAPCRDSEALASASGVQNSPRGTAEPSLLSDDENDDDEDNAAVELPPAPPVPPKDRKPRSDVRLKRQSYHPQQQEFQIEDQDDVFFRKPGFLSNHRHTLLIPHSESLASVPASISSIPPVPNTSGIAPSLRSGLRRESSKLTLKRKTLTNKLKRAFSMSKLNKRT